LTTRALNYPDELRSQIYVGVTILGDDILGPIHGTLECLFQKRSQLREDGNPSVAAVCQVLLFRGMHKETVFLPVDVDPPESQVLGRATQAAVSRQGDDELPFVIRGCVNRLGDYFPFHEELPIFVRVIGCFHLSERIALNEFIADRGLEELTCPPDRPANRRDGVPLLLHPQQEVVGFAFANAPHIAVRAKAFDEPLGDRLEIHNRAPLCSRNPSLVDEAGQEGAQLGCLARSNQPYRRKPRVQIVSNLGQPSRRLIVDGSVGDLGGVQVLDLRLDRFRRLHRRLAEANGSPLPIAADELDGAIPFGISRDTCHTSHSLSFGRPEKFN
jgi:hypothetical protein